MNKLQPEETLLIGNFISEGDKLRRDATTDRIQWLTSHQLQKIAISPESGAWDTLFRDPADGRYWERTFLQSEMHGGGPPTLRYLSVDEAKRKYGVDV